MARQCPTCSGFNVRRSAIRRRHGEHRNFFLSPYRCLDCGARFRVASRRAQLLVAGVCAVLLAAVMGWVGWSWLGELATDPDEVSSAIAEFDQMAKRADKGDADAEYGLARMYAYGDGVAKNAPKERKWLERAAEHGHAQAQYDLAVMLREGRGTIQDHDRSWKWMRSAAEHGSAQAQYELGLMYRAGAGVPPDPVKAYIWLNLAAARGVPGAAAARDAVLGRLSADQVLAAQAEAGRLSETYAVPDSGSR